MSKDKRKTWGQQEKGFSIELTPDFSSKNTQARR